MRSPAHDHGHLHPAAGTCNAHPVHVDRAVRTRDRVRGVASDVVHVRIGDETGRAGRGPSHVLVCDRGSARLGGTLAGPIQLSHGKNSAFGLAKADDRRRGDPKHDRENEERLSAIVSHESIRCVAPPRT